MASSNQATASATAASRVSSARSKKRFGGSMGTTTSTIAKMMVLGFVVWNMDIFRPTTTQQRPSASSSSLVVSSFTPPLASMLTTKPLATSTTATDRKNTKTLLLQPPQLLEPVDSKQRTLSLLKQSKKKYFDDEDDEEEEGIEYYSLANIDQYKNEKQKQRKLLKIEIQLLESLMYSDDGIDELVSLWNNNDDVVGDEDNSKNDSMLLEAELLLRLGHDAQRAAARSSSDASASQQEQNETTKSAAKGKWKTSNTYYYAEEREQESPDTNGYWDRAEALLQQYLLQLDAEDEDNNGSGGDGNIISANDIGKHIMINNLKIGPMNQLAHLYLRQKRYTESIQMYQHILDIKPWHISALRGMVIVHQASNNNNNGVDTKYWSTKCLPPLPMNSYLSSDDDDEHSKYDRVDDMIDTKQYNRRKEWVSRMVSIAKQQLRDMMSSPSLSSNRPSSEVNENKPKVDLDDGEDEEDDEEVFSTSFSYYSTLSKTSSNSNTDDDRLKKMNAAAALKDPSADFSTLFDLDEEDCWQ